MSQKAGHSGNVADQLTSRGSEKESSESPITPTPSYIPAAGDVVEFEYKGGMHKGICYAMGRSVHFVSDAWSFYGNPLSVGENYRKIGFVGFAKGKTASCSEFRSAAKAYFAQPTFKKGDKVQFADNPNRTIYTVDSINEQGNINLDRIAGCFNPEKLELVK